MLVSVGWLLTWVGVAILATPKPLNPTMSQSKVDNLGAICAGQHTQGLFILQHEMLTGHCVSTLPSWTGDYDKRRPLHIAAAEGNVAVVRMLVEDAKAQVNVEDRWGGTPLAEAKRVQAAACIPLLQRK